MPFGSERYTNEAQEVLHASRALTAEQKRIADEWNLDKGVSDAAWSLESQGHGIGGGHWLVTLTLTSAKPLLSACGGTPRVSLTSVSMVMNVRPSGSRLTSLRR